MTPLSLLAAQKFVALLQTNAGIAQQLSAMPPASGLAAPALDPSQVVLSSANPQLANMSLQATYPRVCVYSTGYKNALTEKFRSFSGAVTVTADIWASSNLVNDTDQWIHYYAEAVGVLLQQNGGDWGDGIYFTGQYEVQIQPPAAGGLGFVQLARLTCSLNVSLS